MKKYKMQYDCEEYNQPSNNQERYEWKLIECAMCDSTKFEVIYTDEYETSIRCLKCSHISIVHDG